MSVGVTFPSRFVALLEIVSLRVNPLPAIHFKNVRISMGILWRVFRILTEPVPLKYGKLATKFSGYTDISSG